MPFLSNIGSVKYSMETLNKNNSWTKEDSVTANPAEEVQKDLDECNSIAKELFEKSLY